MANVGDARASAIGSRQRFPSGHEGGKPPWTEERIRALGVVTDLPTAASILGLSRSAAYYLANRDEFPIPVIRAGSRYRVPVAAILAALHLAPDPPSPPT
jgi:predicted DNA-binding transcriptional regulator AlpA